MIYDEIDLKHTYSLGFWFGLATGIVISAAALWVAVYTLEGSGNLQVFWFR